MQITNIVKFSHQIGLQIEDLVNSLNGNQLISFINPAVLELHTIIHNGVSKIEQIAEKHHASPADLPNSSFRSYQWLKFLSQKKWLLTHLHAHREFSSMMKSIIKNRSMLAPYPKMRLSIRHMNYLFFSRQQNGTLFVEINEGFIHAPEEIRKMILVATLGKKKNNNAIIRDYIRTEPYRSVMQALQQPCQPNRLSSRGTCYDLAEIFIVINELYFRNQIKQPRLVWSVRRSLRRMGTYEPDSDTITINRILDHRDVPAFVVEYILYHELLHKHLGIRESNGRRFAHTSYFRAEENKFKKKKQADQFIKDLNRILN